MTKSPIIVRCKCCKKRLTDPQSIILGYGKRCYHKMNLSHNLMLDFGDEWVYIEDYVSPIDGKKFKVFEKDKRFKLEAI